MGSPRKEGERKEEEGEREREGERGFLCVPASSPCCGVFPSQHVGYITAVVERDVSVAALKHSCFACTPFGSTDQRKTSSFSRCFCCSVEGSAAGVLRLDLLA